MRSILSFLFLFSFSQLFAQIDVSGMWKGEITQNEGGYHTVYEFEFFFHQTGNKISGRSYVYVENIYAEMKLTGSIDKDGNLILQESEIVDFEDFAGMEWCLKKIKLKYNEPWFGAPTLTGTWDGFTSFSACTPGKVEMKIIVPKA